MAIYITGDTHGSFDIGKLGTNSFSPKGLSRDDYLIVLGDFGLIWHDPPTSEEIYWLDWLEDKPWTTLFIDGNHENHDLLSSLEIKEWNGGRVHYVNNHVIHLMRGEVFQIGGLSFFAIGGAHSTDKEWRTPGISWWADEVPNEEERKHALATLKDADWKVDYVLTHCPPCKALNTVLSPRELAFIWPDEYMTWLQHEIADNLIFKRWFYGHMHMDYPFEEQFIPLYDSIVELTKDNEVIEVV